MQNTIDPFKILGPFPSPDQMVMAQELWLVRKSNLDVVATLQEKIEQLEAKLNRITTELESERRDADYYRRQEELDERRFLFGGPFEGW